MDEKNKKAHDIANENKIKFLSQSDIENYGATDFSHFLGENSNLSYYTGSIVDINTSKKLEQAYLDGSLKQTGIVDTKNFPQDIPDKNICALLDELVSKNQLSYRECRYQILNYATDMLKEYSLDGRKFVKVSALHNQDKVMLSNGEKIEAGREYWVEVKPINDVLEPEHHARKR